MIWLKRKSVAPPEIYDEDEEENYDEEPNDQEYTFNDWYELAENGDVKAQLIVGHCYFTGTAVTQNYRIAREWFYLAALQGDAIAQLNLSFMYEHGIGMNIEKEEAEKWRWKSGHEATWRPDLINYALNWYAAHDRYMDYKIIKRFMDEFPMRYNS